MYFKTHLYLRRSSERYQGTTKRYSCVCQLERTYSIFKDTLDINMSLYLKLKVSTVTILNYVWYLIKLLFWIVLHNLFQHCKSRIIFNTVLWFSKATPVRLKCIHTLFPKRMFAMGALDSSMIQTIAHWSQGNRRPRLWY